MAAIGNPEVWNTGEVMSPKLQRLRYRFFSLLLQLTIRCPSFYLIQRCALPGHCQTLNLSQRLAEVVLTVLHNRSQNLTANMCLTTLTLSSFFPLNAIKFKFTYSKGWRLVSVIEIFLVNVIVALFLYFGTIPFIICSPLIFSHFNVS